MSEEKMVRCFICRRRLTGLRAKAMGVGPTCAKKHPDRVNRFLAETAGQEKLFLMGEVPGGSTKS